MEKTPQWYAAWRVAVAFDTVEYGGIGVQLFQSDEVPPEQVGFAIGPQGESLVGVRPGDWQPEWVVIGRDTGCGDPIFASQEHPHPVFSAMHGQGFWSSLPRQVPTSYGSRPILSFTALRSRCLQPR
jgi:hypothetical protein